MFKKFIYWYLRFITRKECRKHPECDGCPYWVDYRTIRGCSEVHLQNSIFIFTECRKEAKYGSEESDD